MDFLVVYIREAHAMDSRLPMTYGAIEDPVTHVGIGGWLR